MSNDDLIRKQAAIDEIRRFSGYLDEDMITRINIGLNRLPSVQPDHCSDVTEMDTISRRAAIDEVRQAYENDEMLDGYEYRLGELPSAQPERKKGKWIKIDDGRISGKCSQCGWEAHLYEDDVFGMDYCPNCGAKMEE